MPAGALRPGMEVVGTSKEIATRGASKREGEPALVCVPTPASFTENPPAAPPPSVSRPYTSPGSGPNTAQRTRCSPDDASLPHQPRVTVTCRQQPAPPAEGSVNRKVITVVNLNKGVALKVPRKKSSAFQRQWLQYRAAHQRPPEPKLSRSIDHEQRGDGVNTKLANKKGSSGPQFGVTSIPIAPTSRRNSTQSNSSTFPRRTSSYVNNSRCSSAISQGKAYMHENPDSVLHTDRRCKSAISMKSPSPRGSYNTTTPKRSNVSGSKLVRSLDCPSHAVSSDQSSEATQDEEQQVHGALQQQYMKEVEHSMQNLELEKRQLDKKKKHSSGSVRVWEAGRQRQAPSNRGDFGGEDWLDTYRQSRRSASAMAAARRSDHINLKLNLDSPRTTITSSTEGGSTSVSGGGSRPALRASTSFPRSYPKMQELVRQQRAAVRRPHTSASYSNLRIDNRHGGVQDPLQAWGCNSYCSSSSASSQQPTGQAVEVPTSNHHQRPHSGDLITDAHIEKMHVNQHAEGDIPVPAPSDTMSSDEDEGIVMVGEEDGDLAGWPVSPPNNPPPSVNDPDVTAVRTDSADDAPPAVVGEDEDMVRYQGGGGYARGTRDLLTYYLHQELLEAAEREAAAAVRGRHASAGPGSRAAAADYCGHCRMSCCQSEVFVPTATAAAHRGGPDDSRAGGAVVPYPSPAGSLAGTTPRPPTPPAGKLQRIGGLYFVKKERVRKGRAPAAMPPESASYIQIHRPAVMSQPAMSSRSHTSNADSNAASSLNTVSIPQDPGSSVDGSSGSISLRRSASAPQRHRWHQEQQFRVVGHSLPSHQRSSSERYRHNLESIPALPPPPSPCPALPSVQQQPPPPPSVAATPPRDGDQHPQPHAVPPLSPYRLQQVFRPSLQLSSSRLRSTSCRQRHAQNLYGHSETSNSSLQPAVRPLTVSGIPQLAASSRRVQRGFGRPKMARSACSRLRTGAEDHQVKESASTMAAATVSAPAIILNPP